MLKKAGVALLSLGLVGGCYQGVDALDGTDDRGLTINGLTFNGLTFNGLTFNGLTLNGLTFNGLTLNGLTLNGLTLNGLTLNGLTLNGLTLNGTEFTASADENGEVVDLRGDELIGMVFAIEAEMDGELVPLELMIEDRYLDVDSGYDDIFLYELRARVAGDEEWINPCADEYGVGHPAIPLNNYWDVESGDRIDDDDVISWSCTTGVLAHCVQWGYRPWAEVEDCDKKHTKGKKKGKKKGKWNKWKKCKDVSLRDYHQACTRMARADYCGNGEPWTVPGTQIDIWDNLSPQIQERELHWEIEAEWTPDGAWCLNDIRQQGWKEEGLYPKCSKWQDKKWKQRAKHCGKLKEKSSLLVSSFYLDD